MTGIIVLAAGSSSRLGTPKQDLSYRGRTLLQQAVQTALDANTGFVAVVLGANAESLKPTIDSLPIHIFLNKYWSRGMASSINCGVTEMQKLAPQLSSLILMLCDQPYVDTVILNELINNASPGKIVASAYNNTFGPPALFDQAFFANLLSLSGHEGAKKIMLDNPEAIIKINFPLGAIDIDTIADYDRLGNQTENL